MTRLVIETGIGRDGAIEVRRGLQPGDRVVSRGHADLIEGSVIIGRNADGSIATEAGEKAIVETGVAAQ